jgi:hypothetical protein
MAAAIYYAFHSSVDLNRGYFVYVIDDPYIHMAMAKNMALHGVWGVSQYHFASSSSSLLWTALISLVYWIFGIKQLVPFALNILFGLAAVVFAHLIFRKYIKTSWFIWACC